MATPIKETPILRGEDARRFEAAIANPRPVSREEYERARLTYLSVRWADTLRELARR